jgi:membrane protein implicated in regulation of membrane protease activity
MKPFTAITVVLLALIAVVQLLRFVLGWEVTVNGLIVPVWLSGIAFVITAGLSLMVWREARRGPA